MLRRKILPRLLGFLGMSTVPILELKAGANHGDAEQLQVQLAACSVAAQGVTHPSRVATEGMYGWSPAYQSVLELRRKYDVAVRLIAERAPDGQQTMLYPCGCSATGNPIGCNLPSYCSDHGDPDRPYGSHLIYT